MHTNKLTTAEALQMARKALYSQYEAGEAHVIAEMLLTHILDLDRLGLSMAMQEEMSMNGKETLEMFLEALKTGRPVQYVLGMADFYGLKFKVNEHTLIPRPETEELVEKVLAWVGKRPLKVLEVGTGTGCIAIALKKHAPDLEIISVDISSAALKLAAENAAMNEVDIQFVSGDFLDKTIWARLGEVDIIISNPPYILESEAALMENHVLNFEPHEALFVTDNDPQQFYKAILAWAGQHKRTQAVFLELNQNFASGTLALYTAAGWEAVLHRDLNDNFRMLTAFR
ncbi:MAG: peptide chain release factor N(5)-glutamine methyltransferase [Sphingobacteriales bacterium]|nr:MAG: peptide chain release factor N(5)-glutamine methyltransferase [Sphingobacteriales bacterium]